MNKEDSAWSAGEVDRRTLIATAERLLKSRRQRISFFGPKLFGEPGWDMMLDLFIHQDDRRGTSITSLCIAVDVPPTTALRWLSALTESGLVVRTPDPHDGRRVFLRLSDEAMERMENYLAAVIGRHEPSAALDNAAG